MKIRRYILAVVMAGSAFGPICADNTVVIVPSLENERLEKTQASQQTDNGTNDVKNVNQGLSTLQMVGACVAIPALLAGMFGTVHVGHYLYDRGLTLAHELGHAIAVLAVDDKVGIYMSPAMYGPAGVGCGELSPLKTILVAAAGPVAGIAAHFGLASIGAKITASFYKNGSTKKEDKLRSKLFGACYATVAGLYHYAEELIPSTCIAGKEYAAVGKTGELLYSDGATIQNAMKLISPMLGAAYPYIAYAGFAAFAGYSVYRIYQMNKNLQAEMSKRAHPGHEQTVLS